MAINESPAMVLDETIKTAECPVSLHAGPYLSALRYSRPTLRTNARIPVVQRRDLLFSRHVCFSRFYLAKSAYASATFQDYIYPQRSRQAQTCRAGLIAIVVPVPSVTIRVRWPYALGYPRFDSHGTEGGLGVGACHVCPPEVDESRMFSQRLPCILQDTVYLSSHFDQILDVIV